jgi:hypothetical protein
MKRHLLNLLKVLSLLLCVAVVALWVRSYWLEDNVAWVAVKRDDTRVAERFRQVFSHKGRITWRSKIRYLTFATPEGAALQRTTMRGDGPEWAAEPADRRGSFSRDWNRAGFGGATLVERKPARLVVVRSGTEPVPLKDDVTVDRRVVVPHWAVAALAMVPPLVWLVRRGRRLAASRRKHGLCPACGYDVRASPGRCPECGHTPTEPVAADVSP